MDTYSINIILRLQIYPKIIYNSHSIFWSTLKLHVLQIFILNEVMSVLPFNLSMPILYSLRYLLHSHNRNRLILLNRLEGYSVDT